MEHFFRKMNNDFMTINRFEPSRFDLSLLNGTCQATKANFVLLAKKNYNWNRPPPLTEFYVEVLGQTLLGSFWNFNLPGLSLAKKMAYPFFLKSDPIYLLPLGFFQLLPKKYTNINRKRTISARLVLIVNAF